MLPSFEHLSLYHDAQEPTGAPGQSLATILNAQRLLIKSLKESRERASSLPEHASDEARRDAAEYDPHEQHPIRYDRRQEYLVTKKESFACKTPGCPGTLTIKREGLPDEVVSAIGKESDGRVVCEACGVEQVYASEDMGGRSLAGDTEEERLSRIHNELYRGDQRHLMTHIEYKEFAQGVDSKLLERANTRLNQCRVWFVNYLTHTGVLREYEYGFWLTESEITEALRLVRAMCKYWAEAGGYPRRPFGSPIFLVLALTLQMVSERPGGFKVSSVGMQDLLTMNGLHSALERHAGTKVRTDESEQAATNAAGSGARGQSILEEAKYRKVAMHSLGNQREQKKKMVFLNYLLVKAGMTPLSTVVLDFERPALKVVGNPLPLPNDDFIKTLLRGENYKLVTRTEYAHPHWKLGRGRKSDGAVSRSYMGQASCAKLTDASVVEQVFAQLRL